MIARLCLFLWTLCLAAPALAEWHRAESEHYIVHADMREADLREIVQTLEDLDRVLRALMPPRIGPGQKLQLYLTPGYDRISGIAGMRVSGFPAYSPESMMAFARFSFAEPAGIRYEAAFFYAADRHLEQAYFQPMAPWLGSGFPQFFATAYTDEEGHFILGAPDYRRPLTHPVTAGEVRTALSDKTSPRNQQQFERFYSVAGAVTAPLLAEPAYAGVLERYVRAYASGMTMEQAAAELGDFETLLDRIDKRANRKRPKLRRFELAPGPPAAIALQPMRRDEIALIDLRFERLREKSRKQAAQRLRALTGRMPDSALVWYEYAAAEFGLVQNSEFAGDPLFRGFGFANGELIVTANRYPDAEAWRAVNRALAIDHAMPEARRLRAEILLNRVVRAGDPDDAAGYDEVRAALAPLARDPRRNPLAAALYHQSYVEQGIAPPPEAFEQLGEAFRANASVTDFRYAYAVALSRLGRVGEARSLLTSMLNDPKFEAAARRALEAAP